MKTETQEWLRIADQDLDAAKLLLDGGLVAPAIFHCQQAIERYFKAFWIEGRAEGLPPRTHDLVQLLRELDIELPAWQDFLAWLSEQAITDGYIDPTRGLHPIGNVVLQEVHDVRRAATPTEIAQAVEDFVQSLSKGIRVERIVLFGSYVNGKPDEWSDFDLAVISPDFEGLPLWKRQDMIARLTVHRDRRISPLGYPSSEYHNPGPHSFLREIIRTGKVVYSSV